MNIDIAIWLQKNIAIKTTISYVTTANLVVSSLIQKQKKNVNKNNKLSIAIYQFLFSLEWQQLLLAAAHTYHLMKYFFFSFIVSNINSQAT